MANLPFYMHEILYPTSVIYSLANTDSCMEFQRFVLQSNLVVNSIINYFYTHATATGITQSISLSVGIYSLSVSTLNLIQSVVLTRTVSKTTYDFFCVTNTFNTSFSYTAGEYYFGLLAVSGIGHPIRQLFDPAYPTVKACPVFLEGSMSVSTSSLIGSVNTSVLMTDHSRNFGVAPFVLLG